MRVVVTGGNGFLGTYIVGALKRDGHEVVAAVRPGADADHLAGVVDETETFALEDDGSLRRVAAAGEVIVHNAVDFAVLDDPLRHFDVNVIPSLRLLEYARQAGARQFVFISSGAAYADILDDRPLDERHPTWPSGVYGAWKAGMEPFLKAYNAQYGLATASIRPVGIYGVAPKLERSQWHQIVLDVLDGKTIDTAHGGKIIHVEDVADAVALAIGNDAAAGQFYNLVDCHIYDQTVAEFARELSGSSVRIIDRKGTGPRHTFDTVKTREFGIPMNRGHQGAREYLTQLLDRVRHRSPSG